LTGIKAVGDCGYYCDFSWNQPPPQTAHDAEKRLKEGYECTDWYFCKKDLAA
jgi:hypothetical protein